MKIERFSVHCVCFITTAINVKQCAIQWKRYKFTHRKDMIKSKWSNHLTGLYLCTAFGFCFMRRYIFIYKHIYRETCMIWSYSFWSRAIWDNYVNNIAAGQQLLCYYLPTSAMSVFNSSPGHNDQHFADESFQRIFMNGKVFFISIFT